MKSVIVALVTTAVLAVAQDSVSVLARILADKGTISRAELAQVESAAPGDRVRVLAELLQNKGVLSASEVARVNAPAGASQLTATNGGTAPQRTTGGQPAPAPAAAPPVTTQSRLPLTLYGTLLMNSAYNTALYNITDIPLFAAKQGSDALGNDKTFAMTARQTRLGLRYENPAEIMGARLNGVVEVDFLGGKAPFGNGANMDLLRLRLAYGRLDWHSVSLEAGQDWTIFAPLNPTSFAEYAIPSMSASGNPWIRMPQVRFDVRGKAGGVGVLAQFAAIDPNMGDYSTTTFSATRAPGVGERGRAPGAEARFAFTGKHDDRDFTVGFSGHYAHGKNSGTVGSVTEQLPVNSWGAALDYSLPLTKVFNLSGELFTGNALGIFSVDAGQAIQPVGTPGDKGVPSSGGWMQAQFNFTRAWQMNLVYGIETSVAHDLPVGARNKNQSYMGNLMYKYTPHATIAFEYRRVLTDFRNQPAANEHGDVANLAFAYIF